MNKTIVKKTLGLLVMALSFVVGAQKAEAVLTSSANLDLHVNFSGQLSVKVDDVYASTRAVSAGPNTAVVPSSASVTNDSTGLTEQWQLSLAASTGNWTVNATTSTTPGLDHFDYQALFVSSVTTASNCPASGASQWDNNVSTVSTSPVPYRSDMFADPTAVLGATGLPDVTSGVSNGNMYTLNTSFNGAGRRGLCVRLRTPSSVSTQQTQLIRLTVTAAPAL